MQFYPHMMSFEHDKIELQTLSLEATFFNFKSSYQQLTLIFYLKTYFSAVFVPKFFENYFLKGAIKIFKFYFRGTKVSYIVERQE